MDEDRKGTKYSMFKDKPELLPKEAPEPQVPKRSGFLAGVRRVARDAVVRRTSTKP